MSGGTAEPGEVSVTFCYNDYRDLEVDEAPCVPAPGSDPGSDDWSAFEGLVAENEEDMGDVVIRQGDDVEVRVEDSLIATITNLLIAVPDLVDRRHVVIPGFQMYGYLRMDPEASDQLISGDHVPTVRVKRVGLIPGIVDLGERFCDFLEHFVAERDDYAAIIEDLRDDKLPTAQAALQRWDPHSG